jgi:hypothetical protein
MANPNLPPLHCQLILFSDRRATSWLSAVDWTGAPRGSLAMPSSAGNGSSYDPPFGPLQAIPNIQAADGSKILLSGEILDLRGSKVGTYQGSGVGRIGWADDNSHLCGVQAGNPGEFFVQLPGRSRQVIAHLGHFDDGRATAAAVDVLACSFRTHRAVLAQTDRRPTGNWSVTDVWSVDLISHRVATHLNYSPGYLYSLVISSDGRYLAENAWPTTPSPATATIKEIETGSTLASLPGQMVLMFSGDGSLVLADNSFQLVAPPGGYFQKSLLHVVNWTSGSTVWAGPGPLGMLTRALARPDGRDFALGFSMPPVPGGCAGPGGSPLPGCPPDYPLLIVHGDGSSLTIDGQPIALW